MGLVVEHGVMGSGLYRLVAWLLRRKTTGAASTAVASDVPVAPVAPMADEAGAALALAESVAPVIAPAVATDDDLLIDLAAPAHSAGEPFLSESVLPEPVLPEPVLVMAALEPTFDFSALTAGDDPQARAEMAPTPTAAVAPSSEPQCNDEALLIEAALQLRDLVTPAMPIADALSIAALMESAMAVLHDADAQVQARPDVDDAALSSDAPGAPLSRTALCPRPVRRVSAVPKANRPYASPQRPKRQVLGEKAKSKPRRSVAASPAKRKAAQPPQRVVWLAPRQAKPAIVTPAAAMPIPAPAIDTLASAAEAVRAMFSTATPDDAVTQAA